MGTFDLLSALIDVQIDLFLLPTVVPLKLFEIAHVVW